MIGRPNYGYDEALGGCRTGVPKVVRCSICAGTGQVSWEQVEGRHFGARIQGWRAAKNMLSVHMADVLGIKVSELSAYENGRRPWPEEIRMIVAEFLVNDRRPVPVQCDQISGELHDH